MKKKKAFCLALASVLVLSVGALGACNEDETPDTPDPVEDTNKAVMPVEYLDTIYENNARTESGEGMNSTHDPVIVEAKKDGKSVYYAFSTDNDQYGVQVRKSSNLYKWERKEPAINGYTSAMKESDVKQMYSTGSAELMDVYNVVRSFGDWSNCWTLWAPDVVPATSNASLDADGEWWLYSCWTAGFGSMNSVIFKCKSTNGVEGPYLYESIIVQSSGSDGGLNEIDPSVYKTPDGKLFLSYGSYGTGFATIELDPATGLRKSGEVTDPGTRILAKSELNAEGSDIIYQNVNAEGSVISYHTVKVYNGDIANEDYDESKWEDKSRYYMMGSWGALAYNYNMRVWTSDTPDGMFTSERGENGLQVSGSWTWRKQGQGVTGSVTIPNNEKDLNYYIPGHNDMLTTTDGRNLIIYHTRVSEGTKGGKPSFQEGEHYLYTSLYDFNSKGQLVINPNRFAGEKIGDVTKDELLAKAKDGKFSAIVLTSANLAYETKATIGHAQDCTLNADGTVSGAMTGTWKMYGSHYIYLNLDGVNYYGSVMPAYVRQFEVGFGSSGAAGYTISAISDVVGQENKILYMNTQF